MIVNNFIAKIPTPAPGSTILNVSVAARVPDFTCVTTAYREMLSLDPNDKIDGLTAKELNAVGNVAQFVVKGSLSTVLDLTETEILRDFFNAIKSIILPTEFTRRAAQIKIPSMRPVRSLKELRETLFRDDWRLMPMQFDVPANSQILGQIAYNAGIEGIIFPSGKTKKRNIAIYPGNFKSSDSFVEIVGEVAGSVEGKRIDKRTYKQYLWL